MMSNWHVGDSVCDSQNFTLRLSEDSTTSTTDDPSLQRFATNRKTKDEDDIIVISDSSCSPSPERTRPDTSKWKSSSISNVQNKKYRTLHFLEISSSGSEREKESDSSWRFNDTFSKKKYVNRTVVQVNKTPTEASLISNDLTSERLFDVLLTSSNNTTGSSSMSKAKGNVLSKRPTFNTPKQDSTGKARLTKNVKHKILQNIKGTQIVYDSPKERKENHVIIDESTDREEDMMHPAISPIYGKKVQRSSNRPDVIDTSFKNAILQTNLSKSDIDIARVMDSFRPLSEKRKKEITEWLLTNFSDSQSDYSFNTVPPSARNSNSGNSSLERLEQSYETPNNRGKVNKTRIDEKQETIVNSGNAIHLFSTCPKTLDKYFKKSKNNSEFCTPDNKPKPLPKAQTDKKASSAVNTFETKDVMDCANILDKLYGAAWRDKANAVLPMSEPRKMSVQSTNRIVQTERKPMSKNQHRAVDSDESDVVENNIKSNRERNIQRKQKEIDNFIDDESLSSNDSESIYHSALTNPAIFTRSTTKSMSVSASIKRLQALCDTDTEDEDDKSSRPKNLQGRQLSFSDDESSSTSEFDPGDYVSPKYVRNKVKKPQPSKVTSKFESTMTKPVGYKTFLESLSNTVPMHQTHPNAKKYRLDYKNNKEELCKKLYKLYNEKIFDNKLPQDMSIEWNVRMRGTAGYCYNKKSVKSLSSSIVKSSRIVLATKILDTPDRLRDTLIHEMCHAASWIIDGVSDGHGVFWTRWTNKVKKIFPELPPIRRCHNYEIKTKFTYKCTGCGYSIGRHSKSLDIEKKRCGYCYGKFELLINKTTRSGTVQQVQTPKREPTGFALYVKQNYNSAKKKSNMRHGDVMKLLGQQFSAIKIAKNTDVTNN